MEEESMETSNRNADLHVDFIFPTMQVTLPEVLS